MAPGEFGVDPHCSHRDVDAEACSAIHLSDFPTSHSQFE